MSAVFNMEADVLRQGRPVSPTVDAEHGVWEDQYDPDSNATIHVWVPFEVVDDDPATPGEEIAQYTIPCSARGVLGQGAAAAGAAEQFGVDYLNVDTVRLSFPPDKVLTKRDRITNIRDSKGNVLWVEEELGETAGVYKPTVFEVLGIVPQPDPFGHVTMNIALLQRAEVQTLVV